MIQNIGTTMVSNIWTMVFTYRIQVPTDDLNLVKIVNYIWHERNQSLCYNNTLCSSQINFTREYSKKRRKFYWEGKVDSISFAGQKIIIQNWLERLTLTVDCSNNFGFASYFEIVANIW